MLISLQPYFHVLLNVGTEWGVVEWVRLVLYQPWDPIPSAISHVKHDMTTISGLKYLLLVLDLDSLNFQVPCDRRFTQPSVTAGHLSHLSSSVLKCFSGNQITHDWIFELIWSNEVIKFFFCMLYGRHLVLCGHKVWPWSTCGQLWHLMNGWCLWCFPRMYFKWY